VKLTIQPFPAAPAQSRVERRGHDSAVQSRELKSAWAVGNAEAEFADDGALGAFTGIAWSSVLGGSFCLLLRALVLAI
jgi:hypothetical protein